MNDRPILTVAVIAYNQEKYIRQTLDGILNQQTQYKYNAIIHDDASTDATAQIIQEYAEKYPDIFIPILEEKNTFQQHINCMDDIIRPQIEAKYVAFCEGDDYWCDNTKIEKTVGFLEEHPDYSFCVHNTRFIQENGESTGRLFNTPKKEHDITVEEIIESEPLSLFHFSSFVTRTDLWKKQPKDFKIRGVGDYPKAIYFSSCGKTHYFPGVMSSYRMASKGSWTQRVAQKQEHYHTQMKNEIEDLDKIDALLNFQYHKSFVFAKKACEFCLLTKKQKIWQSLYKSAYRKIIFSIIKKKLYHE